MQITVAVDSDGTVTWEEALPMLDPQGPAPVDMDEAVPIFVEGPTMVGRKKAA
jgi:hypothetical protein